MEWLAASGASGGARGVRRSAGRAPGVAYFFPLGCRLARHKASGQLGWSASCHRRALTRIITAKTHGKRDKRRYKYAILGAGLNRDRKLVVSSLHPMSARRANCRVGSPRLAKPQGFTSPDYDGGGPAAFSGGRGSGLAGNCHGCFPGGLGASGGPEVLPR